MMLHAIAGTALVLSVIALVYILKKQGRAAEQNDQMRRRLEDIHAANMARDGISRDAAAAKWVRERFTR